MSSVFNYFKRKINPFKICVSNDNDNPNDPTNENNTNRSNLSFERTNKKRDYNTNQTNNNNDNENTCPNNDDETTSSQMLKEQHKNNTTNFSYSNRNNSSRLLKANNNFKLINKKEFKFRIRKKSKLIKLNSNNSNPNQSELNPNDYSTTTNSIDLGIGKSLNKSTSDKDMMFNTPNTPSSSLLTSNYITNTFEESTSSSSSLTNNYNQSTELNKNVVDNSNNLHPSCSIHHHNQTTNNIYSSKNSNLNSGFSGISYLNNGCLYESIMEGLSPTTLNTYNENNSNNNHYYDAGSMITYNTKFANSTNFSYDDGLVMSESLEHQHQLHQHQHQQQQQQIAKMPSCMALSVNIQQSTPFSDLFSPTQKKNFRINNKQQKLTTPNSNNFNLTFRKSNTNFDLRLLQNTKSSNSHKQLNCGGAIGCGSGASVMNNADDKKSKMSSEEFNCKLLNKQQIERSAATTTSRRKCRRSNTTYTIAGSKTSKIIDYFTKLEVTRPALLKKKDKSTKTSNLNEMPSSSNHPAAPASKFKFLLFHKSKSKNLNDSSNQHQHQQQQHQTLDGTNLNGTVQSIKSNQTNKDEIEKIQDVFFHDESSLINQTNDEPFNASIGDHNLINNSSYFESSPHIITTGSSSAVSESASPLSTRINNKNQTESFECNQIENREKTYSSYSSPSSSSASSNLSTNDSKCKLNETSLTNSSIEKIRRSFSLPGGLNEPPNTSSLFANLSKISTIKDTELPNEIENFKEDEMDSESTPTNRSNEAEAKLDEKELTIENLTENSCNYVNLSDMSNNGGSSGGSNGGDGGADNSCTSTNGGGFGGVGGGFIRGDPQTRLSKNIKQMFQDVVRYQMNALSNLEKFYEAQLEKLENDRKHNIELNPNDEEKINEFFDDQLAMLEERVHSSLSFICQSKCKKRSSLSSSRLVTTQMLFDAERQAAMANNQSNETTTTTTSAAAATTTANTNNKQTEIDKNLISTKLAQIIALRQCQQQNAANTNNQSRQISSKTFLNLKNSLISQNALLPSKSQLNANQATLKSSNLLELSSCVAGSSGANNKPNQTERDAAGIECLLSPKETMFKRNLSLPFKQCRHNPFLVRRGGSGVGVVVGGGVGGGMTKENKIEPIISKSPKMGALAYSTSRVKYFKQILANSNTSPCAPIQTTNDHSTAASTASVTNNKPVETTTKFQYQKNKMKKYSTSNENIAQLYKANEISRANNQVAKIVKLTNNDSASCLSKRIQSLVSLNASNDDYLSPTSNNNNTKIDSNETITNKRRIISIEYKRNSSYIVNSFFNSSDNPTGATGAGIGPSSLLTEPININEMNRQYPPRLSDSHLLFKLNQQKHHQAAAVQFNNNSKLNSISFANLYKNSQLMSAAAGSTVNMSTLTNNYQDMRSHQKSFQIETEV